MVQEKAILICDRCDSYRQAMESCRWSKDKASLRLVERDWVIHLFSEHK